MSACICLKLLLPCSGSVVIDSKGAEPEAEVIWHTHTHTHFALTQIPCDVIRLLTRLHIMCIHWRGRGWRAAWTGMTKMTDNWDKTYYSKISLSLSWSCFSLIWCGNVSLLPCRLSMTTKRAFSLSSLTEECISPNKKAFTRLIKRHCNAVCNAQFTRSHSPPRPL